MIEINNLTKTKINKKSFSQVAKKVLIGENKESKTLSLAFVRKKEIQKLNKKFRKKDKPTDVLSFSLQVENFDKDYLGEIIICPEIVKEKKEDLEFVFIHGILHLLGYDHERSEKEAKIMEEKEKYYLNL
jgi:probable rRNA maturation factor